MSGFVGVLVSDPWLQSQFTQVELRGLESQVFYLIIIVLNCAFFRVLSYQKWYGQIFG